MANPINLYLSEIEDKLIRENFFRVEKYVREDTVRKAQWTFLTFTFDSAVSNVRIAHRLRFTPLDVILLSVRKSDSSTVTWHFDDFDKTSIVVSTSGPCVVRAYIGRYEES